MSSAECRVRLVTAQSGIGPAEIGRCHILKYTNLLSPKDETW
jgi:hypothetical protein